MRKKEERFLWFEIEDNHCLWPWENLKPNCGHPMHKRGSYKAREDTFKNEHFLSEGGLHICEGHARAS